MTIYIILYLLIGFFVIRGMELSKQIRNDGGEDSLKMLGAYILGSILWPIFAIISVGSFINENFR